MATDQQSADPSRQPPSGVLSALAGLYRRGPDSVTNLSIYAFGMSGLWTAVGSVILQFRVLDIADESRKNGVLGLIALAGLVAAAVAQVSAGWISDRTNTRWGPRLPYIVLGSLGLILATPLLGVANSITSLVLVICVMQVFGNAGQGPANALLLDHVPPGKRGEGAGALNLTRAIGAGIVVVIVLSLMGNYESGGAVWLWSSLAVITGVLFLTTLWSALTLRPRGPAPGTISRPSPSGGASGPAVRSAFYWFLLSMAMIVAALSAMQLYALFFITDKIGLANPAQGALALVVVVVLATAASVYPAGVVSDRIGRMPLLYAATLMASAGAAGLIFIHSLFLLLMIGVVVGIGSGVYLSVAWALATDLVPHRTAARTLGLTSVATLAGSGLARFAGFPIDALNNRQDNLGYDALLAVVALLLLFSVLPLSRAGRTTRRLRSGAHAETAARTPL